MEYQKKIEYAKRIASELQGAKSTEQIQSDLKAEGLYERDITNIFISARKIVGESYQPKIRQFLLENKEIHGSEEFSSVDKDILETLIDQEFKKLALDERRKMVKLVKDGEPTDEILEQVDTRFLSADEASEQLAQLQHVKSQNSGSGRMLNIGGGLGLILLTGVIFMTADRLFYVLPIIGIIMIIRGFTTEEITHHN